MIGFGVQVRETGRKSLALNYMFEGRRRRLYIGDFLDWSTQAAREHARSLIIRLELKTPHRAPGCRNCCGAKNDANGTSPTCSGVCRPAAMGAKADLRRDNGKWRS